MIKSFIQPAPGVGFLKPQGNDMTYFESVSQRGKPSVDTAYKSVLGLQWDTSNSSRPPLKRSEFNSWFGRVFSVDRRVDLHGFSDSSKACCAVIYAQSVVAEDVKVNFLVLKIKAAPLKTLSIPRLELLGCLLLSKLINEMVDDFLGRVVVFLLDGYSSCVVLDLRQREAAGSVGLNIGWSV